MYLRRRDEEEEVTLEERTKKEMDEKAKKLQGKGVKVSELKRKRGGAHEESSESGEEIEQVSKKKGKKKDEDDDYEPDANSTKSSVVSPKKTRRSFAAAAASKDVKENKPIQKEKAGAPTLEETPDIPKKSGQAVVSAKKQDPQSVKKQSEPSPDTIAEKVQAGKKVQATKSDQSKVSKPTDNNEVINLDSPIKNDKAKVVVKANNMVASKSVSIVKIDDDIQEVKSADNQVSKKDETVKSSTQKLYDTRFELFKEFCYSKAGGGVDPMKASTAVIEKFLQQIQKEKNLCKSVLGGYKSAIIKIQADNKSQPVVEVTSSSQPTSSKPSVVAKSVTTRATITPVEAKTATPQRIQATATKSAAQPIGGSSAQQQTKNQQTPQSRAVSAQNQQTPQTRTATAQAKSGVATNTPQSQQKQAGTPQSQARPAPQTAARQQTPQGTPRQPTPQSNPRQQTPQSAQRNQAATRQQTTPQSAQRSQASQPVTTRPQPS